MEFIVPLLIFGIGIAFSVIQSAQESKKRQQRRIDLDKLERPKSRYPSLPNQKPINNENLDDSNKSIWQTLVDDFKEEYQKLEQEEQTKQQPKQLNTSKQYSKRLEQDLNGRIERTKRAARDTGKRTENRVRERYQVSRSEVNTSEAVESTIQVSEQVIDEADNVKDPKLKSIFTVADITFDEKAFVNGVIMNEILGSPKSRKKRR
ncbi:hypothetical protein [Phocicoccus pinnipedialis]|uniref:Uncharacterized protein n=1 Tax=Phocicoccus pinnipedialis TaxID=110845 RepID=A0A6V7RFV7_9BACL|nr:hypothetical protein [Jeotgalicoccus pinnipedialis]MBP1939264.1 hypothetical protein [Jeotgalicoccus pinnipedialis]CAD2076099.1 hypothetical protein JEOPIN946_01175 [Jeotgalicoccus pinnipedialis]